MTEQRQSGSSQGPATDAADVPVIDPTRNVETMIALANRRHDDLRSAEQKHVREVLDLRAKMGEQDSRCAAEIAELRATYAMRIDSIREQHAEALRKAEAQRIDAIREVDTEAVRQAAGVQATQQQALAATVTATAEAMRTQVTAATEAATQRLAVAVEPLATAIESLRRSQYEAQGQKTQVVETQARGAGAGLWIGLAIAGAALFITLIIAVVAVIVATQ